MSPHRLLLFLAAAIALPTLLTFISLLHSHPRSQLATEDEAGSAKGSIRAFFSFHTPSTLFPPSAVISLTDDNSTFFLSRPADFGPSLASDGLSGQLWIGSGFGEDDLGRSGAVAGTEGELGCSDVPGWDDGNQKHLSTYGRDGSEMKQAVGRTGLDSHDGDSKAPKISNSGKPDAEPTEDDGTDDHLHHPLPSSPVSKPPQPGHPAQRESERKGHADIQSIQEGAEITGKVALLSRGGCGFLEKVKWAQRRGAIALIVGDHTRGGALVTMYARGDTSNITIPSLFTSHTTAHLLSSLIPPKDVDDPPQADPESADHDGTSKDSKIMAKLHAEDDQPTFTAGSRPKATLAPKASRARKQSEAKQLYEESRRTKKASWSASLWRFLGLGRHHEDNGLRSDSRRPPSSGRLDWFGEKHRDEEQKHAKSSMRSGAIATSTAISKDPSKLSSHLTSSDDFVIGVQDWRDPDLVVGKSVTSKSMIKSTTQVSISTQSSMSKTGKEAVSDQRSGNTLAGGSITPGSGEYLKPGTEGESQSSPDKEALNGSPHRLLSGIVDKHPLKNHDHSDGDEVHEGLWVTLTPTTMSSSPFFDTLLVLVVSPLVTLTVVYALLLLRSRIRRRRWRAPKSVVERLPIRTYHTMSRSSTASSTRFASPQSSSASSPLLQSSPSNRPRPRSATTSGIGDAVSASLDLATAKASLAQNEKEHRSPKKRRKYNGRQVECVVCLEEYVDGHSRVMSLPCGHEFHAECM